MLKGEAHMSQTVILGGSAVLDCPVHGDPSPVLRWLRDGKPVPRSLRMQTLHNGSLVIYSITVNTNVTFPLYFLHVTQLLSLSLLTSFVIPSHPILNALASLSKLFTSTNVSCLGEQWHSIQPNQASSAVSLGGGTVCDCPAASCFHLNQIGSASVREANSISNRGRRRTERAGCSQTLPSFP